jgi:hypothetical protein
MALADSDDEGMETIGDPENRRRPGRLRSRIAPFYWAFGPQATAAQGLGDRRAFLFQQLGGGIK